MQGTHNQAIDYSSRASHVAAQRNDSVTIAGLQNMVIGEELSMHIKKAKSVPWDVPGILVGSDLAHNTASAPLSAWQQVYHAIDQLDIQNPDVQRFARIICGDLSPFREQQQQQDDDSVRTVTAMNDELDDTYDTHEDVSMLEEAWQQAQTASSAEPRSSEIAESSPAPCPEQDIVAMAVSAATTPFDAAQIVRRLDAICIGGRGRAACGVSR